MVISWYGLSSFKISSGPLTLVTDPFSKTVGLTPPRVTTDLALVSNIQNEACNNVASLSGDNLFVIDGPGEFDIKGLFIHGIQAQGEVKNQQNGFDYTTIYAIHMEDMRLGFLGSLKQKELSDSQLEGLGEIDILFIPVGGKSVSQAEQAVTIMNQIEPSIVIPMHYAQKGLKFQFDRPEIFLKEMGSKDTKAQDKFTLKKSALAEIGDNTQIVMLNPVR